MSVPDTRMVEDVHGSRVPAHVSLRNTFGSPAFTPSVKLDASETNATYLPSALRVGIVLDPSASSPLGPTDTRAVETTHAIPPPTQVSRPKTSSLRFLPST